MATAIIHRDVRFKYAPIVLYEGDCLEIERFNSKRVYCPYKGLTLVLPRSSVSIIGK